MSKKKYVIKVAELFAGVGGFRLGLEGWKGKSASSGYKKPVNSNFEIVYSNQFEPSTSENNQHASEVYENRFGSKNHSRKNISKVKTEDINNHDLLVGGFPCQDYSVAATLLNSKGLYGKKGVLWWEIERILREKGSEKPKYLMLENVDRLLSSPVGQRGRDFAIMLKSLQDLGYAVEWRVINAAHYGMPQRRRRVFIMGYHSSSKIYKDLNSSPEDWLIKEGVIAKAFPGVIEEMGETFTIEGNTAQLTKSFNIGAKKSPFKRGGVMIEGKVITAKIKAVFEAKRELGEFLIDDRVEEEFYVSKSDLHKWQEAKNGKKTTRVKNGFKYDYTVGKMSFPDKIDEPARTIVTSEGGVSPSRFKHVVESKTGIRRLTPIELERLNMFPDDHTKLEGVVTNVRRAFFMGNALVVGIVERLGDELFTRHIKKK